MVASGSCSWEGPGKGADGEWDGGEGWIKGGKRQKKDRQGDSDWGWMDKGMEIRGGLDKEKEIRGKWTRGKRLGRPVKGQRLRMHK